MNCENLVGEPHVWQYALIVREQIVIDDNGYRFYNF